MGLAGVGWRDGEKMQTIVIELKKKKRMGAARCWGWGEISQRIRSFPYTRWESPRDFLYNMEPIVNNIVSYTLKLLGG